MAGPRVPKYQAIHAVLRERVVTGEYAPGSRLPGQQELAEEFGVTLMTLRQAMAELEVEGLVWAARGKGTFVVDRPVDIRFDNLSSFGAQMRGAGVEMVTEVLAVDAVLAGDVPEAATALEVDTQLTCVLRRRSVADVPFGLQRSYFAADALDVASPADLGEASLYERFESAAGWSIDEARESITAVALSDGDADLLDADPGQAAMLSIRISLNQFGRAFLYDEALLVGGRCTITADRTSDRLSLRYGLSE